MEFGEALWGSGRVETCMQDLLQGTIGLASGTVPDIGIPAVRHYSCRP